MSAEEDMTGKYVSNLDHVNRTLSYWLVVIWRMKVKVYYEDDFWWRFNIFAACADELFTNETTQTWQQQQEIMGLKWKEKDKNLQSNTIKS